MDVNNSIMDIHNSITDIHKSIELWISIPDNWIMDIHNWIMDIQHVSRGNLHLVQERWLKFQYAIIATHNAIKDIHN